MTLTGERPAAPTATSTAARRPTTATRPRAAGRPPARFAGLDGLRALAVLAVVTFHFAPTWLPGGFLGVDLFFVISGYLITRLLLAEIDRTGRVAIGAFYARRARRLLPGVAVLLLAVSVGAAVAWHDELADLRGALLASAGYATNWWFIGHHESYFVATGRPSMLQHLWSLAIEEQFYLVWPWVIVALTASGLTLRRRLGERGRGILSFRFADRIIRVSVLGATVSTALMAFYAVHDDIPYGSDSTRVYFGTDTHSMGLLLGAMAGALAAQGTLSRRRRVAWHTMLSDLAAVIALGAVALAAYRVDEFDVGLYRGGFLVVSALCALVVGGAARPGSWLGWLLDWRVLRWVGARSYSIYLWHWPVTVVTRPGIDLHISTGEDFALRCVLTLTLAQLSYHLVEQPIRVGGRREFVRVWRGLGAALLRPTRPAGGRRGPLRLAGIVAIGAVLTWAIAAMTTSAIRERPVPVTGAISRPAAVPTVSPTPTPSPSTAATSATAAAPVVPATTPAQVAPAVTAVSAFGDSVMLGAAPDLVAALPSTTVDAVEGRQARVVLADVSAAVAAHTLAPVVVIHCGDNGVISTADLTRVLTSLQDRQRVVLVNDLVPRDWEAPNNVTLNQVAKGFGNVVLLDWHTAASGRSDWLFSDGLHLRPPGAAAYTKMIADAVLAG